MEHLFCRRYVEATKKPRTDLKRSRGATLGSVIALGPEEDVAACLHSREDGTVDVNKWVYGGAILHFQRFTKKHAKKDSWKNRDHQFGQKKTSGQVWKQESSYQELRNDFIKSIMWKARISPGALLERREKMHHHVHVCVGALQEVSCRKLLVVGHCEPRRKEETHISGWWCGACGMPFKCRQPNGLLTLQIGGTTRDQVVFRAYAAPDGQGDDPICTLKFTTNLVTGNKLEIVFEQFGGEEITDALRQFVAADNKRAFVSQFENWQSFERRTR